MANLNPKVHFARAFAPATCANLAVGFDILGLAFAALGDTVTLHRNDSQKIHITAIHGEEKLPYDLDENTATVALQAFCKEQSLECGFSVEIHKGIPLSSGLGGSAASAVAALVAANNFLLEPLTLQELIPYALAGEQAASGHAHGDNIVPALFGGITLIKSLEPIEIIQLPIPAIYCILVHPHLQVSTREARSLLKKEILLSTYVKQSAHLAAFITALYEDDLRLLKSSFHDFVIEPQRADLVPGFSAVQQAAMDAGALGMTLSGSGPTLIALAADEQEANGIAQAMQTALTAVKLKSDYWIGAISTEGAQVIEVK